MTDQGRLISWTCDFEWDPALPDYDYECVVTWEGDTATAVHCEGERVSCDVEL